MYNLKVIKTEQDHEHAINELMALMDNAPAVGSSESDHLEVLSVLIEQFESEHYAIDAPDPIQAIEFRMDQMGLNKKDLVPYIGSASKVSEVLNRKRRLSLNMIRRLNEGLGIPAEVLIQDVSEERTEASDVEWSKFPLAEMRKRNYFPEFSGTLTELKKCSQEQVSGLLDNINGFGLKPAMLRTTAHLRSNNKEMDAYALWAWQARVLQRAQQEGKLPAKYVAGSVTEEWMRQLSTFSCMDNGPLLAKEFLNKGGIHLVFERHLPKTYLDGAVCLTESGCPVVALTLRHDRVDNFWFTLMHELAHLSLHMEDSRWFIDDLDAGGTDKLEIEADVLANESLIPSKIWKKFSIATVIDVKQLASQLSIAPCIVAGRARFDNADHKMFGRSFRDKVRSTIELAAV